ncbi:MAG: NUDIX domain-containing protein [Phycisphaeraceae bacterium]|nr:MAG: NUDIX domain-containing protein [Phycisphaeraceae bacterium]
MTSDPSNAGPRIISDVVDVFIFRRRPSRARIDPSGESIGGEDVVEVMQLRRAASPEHGGSLAGTWQPLMGHIEAGETATDCAWRELKEEVGLEQHSPELLGLWSLEQVHPYFLASKNAIMLSPRFAAEVVTDWHAELNDEHDAVRWVRASDAEKSFMWPGQRGAIREIRQEILKPGSLSEPWLRVWPERAEC